MKRYLIILAIIIPLFGNSQIVDNSYKQVNTSIQSLKFEDGFYGMLPTNAPIDKQKHWAAGFIIGASGYSMGYAFCPDGKDKQMWGTISGVGFSCLGAFGKEIVYDKWMGKGTPEYGDGFSTIMGGMWATITINLSMELGKLLKKK